MTNNCKDCEITRPCSCKGMDFKACGYFVNSGKEAALQALHDENERLGIYRDAYYDLLECVHNAVKAGDWIVDGACDPDRHLSKYIKRNNEEF